MLGYTIDDINKMTNAIHDAKLFYIRNSDSIYIDEDPLVIKLLEAQDFLQGLWAEGYFD